MRDADDLIKGVDIDTLALSGLPHCEQRDSLARSNVLMFDDRFCIGTRISNQLNPIGALPRCLVRHSSASARANPAAERIGLSP